MIVKVQLSLASSDGKTDVLVYNQDRSIQYMGAAWPELVEMMGGEHRAFFNAGLVDGDIVLNEPTDWQDW